jgi:hypothetical protein
VLLLGSTGEAPELDDSETREVLRVAAESAAPEKVLIAGIGRESVKATVTLAEAAAEFRYDAVLVRIPTYYASQMSPAAVLYYFRSVADRSPLPVLIYNIPRCVPYNIPVELVAELARHPNILGIKDSSGSVDRIRAAVELTSAAPRRTVTVTPVFEAVTGRMLLPRAGAGDALISAGDLAGGAAIATAPPIKTRTKEVGFQVLTGSAGTLLESREAGAARGHSWLCRLRSPGLPGGLFCMEGPRPQTRKTEAGTYLWPQSARCWPVGHCRRKACLRLQRILRRSRPRATLTGYCRRESRD